MNSDKTVIFAPDTNFFIQCKDAAEIDWGLVSDADKILLVVLNEVHREIDRLKNGGNTRRARRAKTISSELRKLVIEGKEETILKASGPAVSLRLAQRLDPRRTKPDDYDFASADERIAEEAKACSEGFFNGNLILLSDDGMPLRAAQLMGVQICPIPEPWLLSPEPSDQDRVIQKLSERVALLEKQTPIIDLRLDGENMVSISGNLIFYPPLAEDFVEGAMDSLRNTFLAQHPSTSRASLPFEKIIRTLEPAPTEAAVREHHAKYEEWAQRTRDFIKRLPEIYNLTSKGIEAFLILSNSGSAPAEHIVIDVSAAGSIRLRGPMNEDNKIQIPAIPEPPKRRNFLTIGGLFESTDRPAFRDLQANLRFNTPRPARDRHAFYWEFDEPEALSEHCRGECEDFRHGLRDERIRLSLRWDQPKEGPVAGAVKIIASARNLPVPVEKTIPVRLDVEVLDSKDLVRAVILKDLGLSI